MFKRAFISSRIMEENLHFHKVLHLLVEQFITEFEKYIELNEVHKDKVYVEILKRSSTISQEIAAVASTFLTSYETAAVPISGEEITKKMSYLVETSLQQDLIECALIAEDISRNVHLSNDDLHNILYTCAVNGKFSLVPSSMQLLTACSSEYDKISSNCIPNYFSTICATDRPKETSLPLSTQLESTCSTFESEVLQLKNSLRMGLSCVDLKFSDVGSSSGEKCVGDSEGSKPLHENITSVEDWLQSVVHSKEDCNGINDVSLSFPERDYVLGWESRVRQSVPCHLYTSELNEKEFPLNVIDEDPHMFRSLHDASGVVSEYDFALDALDLLVGIPSNTFLYDKVQKKFLMKSHSRLFNLSYESTSKFSKAFIEAGNMFYNLKSFCTEYIQSAEGLVLKGLKSGIKEILSVYMEYIATVKMNNPTLLMLRTDILENAVLLSTLGVVCGIPSSGSDEFLLPKGLGLLSFLNKVSWSCKSKENAIMAAVLLKFAYSPYFEFLNKWMTEGVCCDPYNEFQIAEDIRYLDRTDELYWKFAFTNIEDDSSRTIPLEFEKYSHDILQCGKSMRLLQNCCPQLYSLEYMCCNPPPCFSMVFSYRAVNVKRDKCTSYSLRKETSELKQKKLDSTVPKDNYLTEKQLIVDKRVTMDKIQGDLPLGSFINSLATLLLSDYGDTKEDICSCLQLTSLQNLMQNNFSAVMNMRIHLVQKTIADYLIKELRLKELLLCLKNTYFLQDECFSQSLCKKLFNWVMKCDSLDEFANWTILNEMLTRAVAVPSFTNVTFLETASVNFVAMPEEYISKRNKFMQYFNFEFKIDWPLNIIIHKDCITHYSRIFSFILEIEFLCWMLAKIWRLLLISAKENHLENSPQYRKLMLERFDMHQFIRVLRNCIHQDLGGPLWESLEKTLRTEEISIDTLEEIHKQYIVRALARCFLTEETFHLHDVLEFLFEQVEKFCRAAHDCSWVLNPDTSHFESSEFESSSDSYTKYQKLKETFYERILKVVRRKKFQRLYDEHYQLYLETILETGRNM